MKEQGRVAVKVEIWLHSFWTTALDEISGRLHAQAVNFVGNAEVLTDGLDSLEKRQHFFLTGIEPRFLAHHNPLQSQYKEYSMVTAHCFYNTFLVVVVV